MVSYEASGSGHECTHAHTLGVRAMTPGTVPPGDSIGDRVAPADRCRSKPPDQERTISEDPAPSTPTAPYEGVLEGQGAPPVVAIVVTRDPGDWLEATVASLEAQDYPQLSILVVDNASESDPTDRIAVEAPGAFVKHRSEDEGFSAAANEAVSSVEGAPFLLVCHDDVVLAPDAVTQLVAEAFRANAGVVGPKLRDWTNRDVLRSVGLSVDRFGAARELVDEGELDQSQHDISREVFAVSDACVLVRADLYGTIGGFSEAIPYFGEDVDLCWKAHLAGATVQYCHRAVAYHRGDFASRRDVEGRDRLELRHQARMALAGHDGRAMWRVVPAALGASLVELLVSLVLGRGRVALDIVATYLWVLSHPLEIHRARKRRSGFRHTSERDWTTLQRRGSNRMRMLGTAASEENRLVAASRASRERLRSATKEVSTSRLGVAVAVLVPLIVLIGARDLWFGVLPSMREFTTLGDSTGALLSEWWTGWRSAGVGEPSLPPAAVPGLGLLGTLLVFSAGAARRVVILAPLLLGPIGAWRLYPKGTAVRARAAVVAVYALAPVALNAVGEGRLQALVAYAAAPWLLRRLARSSGFEPVATRVGGTAAASGLRTYAGTALLLGVLAALSPLAAIVSALCSLLVLVGASLRQGMRCLLEASKHLGIALLGAAALNLPWLVSAVRKGDLASVTGVWSGRGVVPSAAEMLTGSVGDVRTGLLGWGIVLAAAVPLFTGRGWRSAWAVGAWFSVAGGLAVAAVLGQADAFAGAGVEVFLVPVALGLAVATSMAPLAFEYDVVRSDFGSRQIISFAGAIALLLGLVPVLLASTQGRWYSPEGDFDRALALVDGGDDFRALWIGDPDVLPLAGWPMGSVDGVNLGFSEGLDPEMPLRWRLDGGGSLAEASEAITAAMEGRTARMGRLISTMSVRYVVAVDSPAPEPFATSEVPLPDGVVDALEEQLDLRRILVAPGIDLFEVSAPWPPRSDITEAPEPGTAPPAILGTGFGTRFSGELEAGTTVAQAVTADPGWHLRVDGEEAERQPLFTWGQRFTTGSGGSAELSWSTPLSSRAGQLWQLFAFGIVVFLATRRRSLPTPGRNRRVRSPSEPLVVVDGPGESPDDWMGGAAGTRETGDASDGGDE